jgi:hypothetical protein
LAVEDRQTSFHCYGKLETFVLSVQHRLAVGDWAENVEGDEEFLEVYF